MMAGGSITCFHIKDGEKTLTGMLENRDLTYNEIRFIIEITTLFVVFGLQSPVMNGGVL